MLVVFGPEPMSGADEDLRAVMSTGDMEQAPGRGEEGDSSIAALENAVVDAVVEEGSIGVAAAAVLKTGNLRKLGGKKKDKWEDKRFVLTAGGLVWKNDLAKKMLKIEDIASVAIWSDIGISHAFEIVTRVKDGKVYKVRQHGLHFRVRTFPHVACVMRIASRTNGCSHVPASSRRRMTPTATSGSRPSSAQPRKRSRAARRAASRACRRAPTAATCLGCAPVCLKPRPPRSCQRKPNPLAFAAARQGSPSKPRARRMSTSPTSKPYDAAPHTSK